MSLENILLLVNCLSTGLIAGLFFGYAVSVNGGLHRLKDGEYVRAMQEINLFIQNPIFLITFLAPAITSPVFSYYCYQSPNQNIFHLSLASSVFYLFGTFGLTVVGNVPLNNQLAEYKHTSEAETKELRSKFESPWNRLHLIRTVFSIVSFLLLLIIAIWK